MNLYFYHTYLLLCLVNIVLVKISYFEQWVMTELFYMLFLISSIGNGKKFLI